MRIPIAVQLGLLVLLTALIGLATLSIATWINNYNLVVHVTSQGLQLVATIKSSQIASNLEILQTTCANINTRVLVQSALQRYYAGNYTSDNWVSSFASVQSALGAGGYLSLYQASVYAKLGHAGVRVLNVSASNIPDIELPYRYPDGTAVMLGDDGLGYPPSLFPNLTFRGENRGEVYAFEDVTVSSSAPLLLGPLTLNSSFSLVSLTLPIINNTSSTDVLGYMTVVASAAYIQSALSSRQGLGNTGQVLLLGPTRIDNRFAPGSGPATANTASNTTALGATKVHYVFQPTTLYNQASRHNASVSAGASFTLDQYPAALEALSRPYASINRSVSNLSTKNEEGVNVAVGVIQQRSELVEWVLIIEETHTEAFAAVTYLRKIILACVFATIGFIAVMILPLTHLAVGPIRRLREATRKSIHSATDLSPSPSLAAVPDPMDQAALNEKVGVFTWARWLRRRGNESAKSRSTESNMEPRQFQIPSRVKEREHWVTDELTELTSTFNEMSDELLIQYNRLEERVAERTRELEKAKIAAETANESKTLFIANISHELKTPLNGILGMCAVCMGEDDLPRIKKSLQTVYKSGDLLLHLLNDLLTFSRNQIDQAIRLEEREFQLYDIKSQLAVIFQNQVQEKQISFSITFCGPEMWPRIANRGEKEGLPQNCGSAVGPPGTGRLKDMVLWGDQHRILQILINLVSNSLKFTPENGTVEIRIKCLGEDTPRSISPRPPAHESRRLAPWRSRGSSYASSLPRSSFDRTGDSLEDRPDPAPPAHIRTLAFQFEVEDTGPGIPRHLQQRVFEPFVQGDLRLNRKYGGTGLGLSICTQLSRLMGGSILLESEPGKGTLFSVRIPLGFVKESAPSTSSSSMVESRTSSVFSLDELATLARPPSNNSASAPNEQSTSDSEKQDSQPRLVGLSQPFFAPPVHPEKSDEPKKVRALVAEDNVVNQEVVLRMLALEEVYDVTVVKDGQEAYDTVKANMEEGKVFDLIFMDIQMPNLDGIQSTRLIRQMGYSAPIVALSAFSEDSNIKDCMNSGMDMFISKPIRRPALKQVLRKYTTIPEELEKAADT
ncbi:hypothetical protein P175DRAFT_0429539 [Aspergillus ochraceoroseus IBT 24754]|uniref:histidine kinase n=2 Tax=Aspergillus ochraceoroseus TaxID=138278 RepID=A0A2T5M639_9EURO|nr:uncharacterized protein P175DRAFT_0429539 [Aspergillus ochraceoroseus IBT 24754]KKK17102.1 hypothetical protein AOCH_003660 [Aspergillus ochraceoroseus]PTU24001.1 hypothetical protein P175DRAFT_0429539 [Aspergillus ochraceoroseus IBT 24754]